MWVLLSQPHESFHPKAQWRNVDGATPYLRLEVTETLWLELPFDELIVLTHLLSMMVAQRPPRAAAEREQEVLAELTVDD
jgi:hypothetical protein